MPIEPVLIDARDTALIFEGGGTRNSYTAPVVEKLIANNVQFGWVGGVSAGASHTLNFASRDAERSHASFTDFVGNREFGGWRTVVRGKGLLNGEFIYEGYEQKLPFDLETFLHTEEQIHIEAVRADTGETVAYSREDLRTIEQINIAARTSSTLPLVMKMREVDGVPYVDGALGTSGGILIQAAKDAGFQRFLVVLTRPRDYVKPPEKRERALRRILRRTPRVVDAMLARPGIYNEALAEVKRQEAEGNAYVFYPEQMSVESTEMHVEKLKANYASGQAQVGREWEAIREFLNERP